jgi:hypothetical protein
MGPDSFVEDLDLEANYSDGWYIKEQFDSNIISDELF